MKRGEKPLVRRKRRTKAELAASDDGRIVPEYQRKASPEGVAGTIAALSGVEKIITAGQLASMWRRFPEENVARLRSLAAFFEAVAKILEDGQAASRDT